MAPSLELGVHKLSVQEVQKDEDECQQKLSQKVLDSKPLLKLHQPEGNKSAHRLGSPAYAYARTMELSGVALAAEVSARRKTPTNLKRKEDTGAAL